jgi:hypothetical protein
MSYEPDSTGPEARFGREAAMRAVTFVQSGMKVGLGTGSTAIYATQHIAELLRPAELRDIAVFGYSGGAEPGVRGLTEAAQIVDGIVDVLELASHNTLVVGVGPGAVATPINLSTMENPDLLKKLDDGIPLGRLAQPDEIGAVVVFLADEGASYMTVTTIFADGGLMHSSPGLKRSGNT